MPPTLVSPLHRYRHPLQHCLHPLLTSHLEAHCSGSCHRLEPSSRLLWSGDLCDKNGQTDHPQQCEQACADIFERWLSWEAGTGEREGTWHTVLSVVEEVGQGFRQSAQGREIQPPVSLEASVTKQRSQDILHVVASVVLMCIMSYHIQMINRSYIYMYFDLNVCSLVVNSHALDLHHGWSAAFNAGCSNSYRQLYYFKCKQFQ